MNKKILSLATILLISFSIFMGLGTVKSQVVGSGSIDSGLVGYWRFDENSGIVAFDSSIKGNYGNITNNPTWVNGKFGKALNFSNNQYVNVPASTGSSLVIGNNSFTFSAWVYISESYTYMTVFGGGVGACALYVNDLHLRLSKINIADSGISTGIISLNSWQFITVTFDNSTKNINYFFNGNFDSTVNFNYVFSDIYRTNIIGSYTGYGDFFFGVIDESRIYNRVLSQQEISELYNGYFVSVLHDLGSTVTPNGTVNIGVDQYQGFIIGAKDGYVPALVYWNNIPYSTSPLWFPNNGVYGLQSNASMFFTSQYIGFPNITPSPTVNNMQTGSLANFFSNFDSLTLMMVIGVIVVFVLISSLILLTKRRRFFK